MSRSLRYKNSHKHIYGNFVHLGILVSQILFFRQDWRIDSHFSYARKIRSSQMRGNNGPVSGCSGWDCQRFTHLPSLLGLRLMIVSVALSICQFRFFSQPLTRLRHPILRRSAYAESPAFCCLDFPPRLNQGENPGSQSAAYSILHFCKIFH